LFLVGIFMEQKNITYFTPSNHLFFIKFLFLGGRELHPNLSRVCEHLSCLDTILRRTSLRSAIQPSMGWILQSVIWEEWTSWFIIDSSPSILNRDFLLLFPENQRLISHLNFTSDVIISFKTIISWSNYMYSIHSLFP